MANKRIILIQMEGSKKNFVIGLDAFLQILRERKFNTLQLHHGSENWKLLSAMEKEADATMYKSKDEYDVGYDI